MRSHVASCAKTKKPSEETNEPHPVKRTVKKYKIFLGQQCKLLSVFLCSEIKFVFFQRCENTQITLYTLGIVIADIILNHLNKSLLAGEAFAIIAFTLQNTSNRKTTGA